LGETFGHFPVFLADRPIAELALTSALAHGFFPIIIVSMSLSARLR